MRRLILRILLDPWGFRIVCGITFLVIMVPIGIGLKALKRVQDPVLSLEVGVPVIIGGLILAWWMDRKGWS